MGWNRDGLLSDTASMKNAANSGSGTEGGKRTNLARSARGQCDCALEHAFT